MKPMKPTRSRHRSVLDELIRTGYRFDFFQAVRLLERMARQRRPSQRSNLPEGEVARFRSNMALSFSPGLIEKVEFPAGGNQTLIEVNFLGLTGPSSVLPHHYTELLFQQAKEGAGEGRTALRDWFSLFDHRMISLFMRAWEKYRFQVAFERREYARAEPDSTTMALLAFVGLATRGLRDRVSILVPASTESSAATTILEPEDEGPRILRRIDDLALLRYSGLLSHRPRSALGLRTILEDFFQELAAPRPQLRVEVEQFVGQWLPIEPRRQTRLGPAGQNDQLGQTAVVGARVWDVESKVRLRVGPIPRSTFDEFLPDPTPVPRRKLFFLFCEVVRLYVGIALDFEVQVLLDRTSIEGCAIGEPPTGEVGAHLGWNTWLGGPPEESIVGDAVFVGRSFGAGFDSLGA